MRARLLEVWPDLGHLFGLHPWDVHRLSVAELGQYLDARDQVIRAQRKRR